MTIPLVASEWSSVFPRENDAVPFAEAKADVQVVGMTFGGCFAGHGVYVPQGSARFIVREFSVK